MHTSNVQTMQGENERNYVSHRRKSQIFTVPRPLPLATHRPSGENAAANT